MDNSNSFFGKDSKAFNQKFILPNGVEVLLIGKESERGYFVILSLEDLIKLCREKEGQLQK